MPQKAHVTSLDALEAFRSNLIVYLSQARPALDEISAEVQRTRTWLETDQRVAWEHQMRKRAKRLEEAQQALFSARIGVLRKETVIEQMAVHRAKAGLDEADQKLRVIKKWDREFDGRVQPLLKQIEKLHTVLSHDMVKAVSYLTQVIATLAAYAEKAPLDSATASVPATVNPPVSADAASAAGLEPDAQGTAGSAGDLLKS